METAKTNGCKVWEEGMNRQNRGVFRAVKLFLHDNVMLDIPHYIFVKTHRIYKTQSEPLM